MAITNTTIVDIPLRNILYNQKRVLNETDQDIVDGEKLKDGTNQSKLCLIECHYQIKKAQAL